MEKKKACDNCSLSPDPPPQATPPLQSKLFGHGSQSAAHNQESGTIFCSFLSNLHYTPCSLRVQICSKSLLVNINVKMHLMSMIF